MKLLLEKFGLTDAEVTEENLQTISDQITDAVTQQLLAQEDFYTKIDRNKLPKDWFNEQFSQGANKIASLGKQAIDKHLGITNEDKASFSEEDLKDMTKYVAKASEIVKTRLGSGNKDVSKLQDELVSLKQQLEGKETEIASIKEKFESDFNEKLTAKEMETLSMIEASQLAQNLIVNPTILFDKVFAQVKSKFNVVVEAGVPKLKKKDNPAFDAMSADGKSKLSLKDALLEEYKSLGVFKEATPAQPNNIQVQVGAGGKVGITDAMKKAIEEEKLLFG